MLSVDMRGSLPKLMHIGKSLSSLLCSSLALLLMPTKAVLLMAIGVRVMEKLFEVVSQLGLEMLHVEEVAVMESWRGCGDRMLLWGLECWS